MALIGSMDVMNKGNVWTLIAAIGLAVLNWAGCASAPPSGPTHPTNQQIRGDSDRFFDKMKQEEKERAGQAK